MKFTLLVAAALLLSGAVHVYGQVTATWPLSQTTGRTVTTTDPNLLARSELFTGSLRISGYSGPNSSQRIGFNAIPWPTSISDTLYVEYSVTPATGFDFYVDSIKLLLGQSGGGQMFATVRASTDTTFATYTEFWTSDPNPVAPAGAQTSLAFAPGFTVANGQRYFLRIYPWYGLPSTGKYICPQNVIISGFLVIPGDSLSASTTALNPFQNLAGSPSDAQTYTLTGSGLTTDVTITPPPEFEVSTDGGSTWHNNSSPAMLPQVGGTIPGQPLSVMARMNASVGGSFTGMITNASPNAVSKRISVTGMAIDSIALSLSSLARFQQATGVPSAAQLYTVSGYGLSDDVTITPPDGYEVSSDGGTTWHDATSPIVLTRNGTDLAGQPVAMSVRLNGPAIGLYAGGIMHSSAHASTKALAVNGVTLAAEPTVPSAITFGPVTGTSMIVNFEGGNGSNRIVVARPGAAVSWAPVDGRGVAGADSNFLLASDQGNGNKVVYDGTGSSTMVTNLLSQTTYHFAAYEYNTGGDSTQNYLTSAVGTGSQETLVFPDTLLVSQAALSFGPVTVNAASGVQSCTLSGLNFTPASGALVITAPSGFRVSGRSDLGFSPTLNVPYYGGGLVSTTFYVEFLPTSPDAYNDSLTIVGGGARQDVLVSGTGATTIIGGTYFVSPSGSDGAAGTFGDPFGTIQHAVSLAVGGDTIYVRGGSYRFSGALTLSSAGDPDHYIHLWAYPGERVDLDRSVDSASRTRGLTLSGSYWHIRGFDIHDAGANGMYISGLYNIIEQCSVFGNDNSGMQIDNGGGYNRIINCDSYWNFDWQNGGGNADGFAPKLGEGGGNYFYGCRSWQNSDDGWDGYLRPADNVADTVDNCWSFMNGYLRGGELCPGNGNGFKTGGSDNRNLRHNMLVQRCLAFQNKAKGFDQNGNIGSMTFLNCTAYDNGIGTPGGYLNFAAAAALAPGCVLTAMNDISLGSNGVDLLNPVVATNSWPDASTFPTTVTTATPADFVTLDTTGVRGPRQPDGSLPSVAFMHLANTSQFIDAGTIVGLPFYGRKPDLGCFESNIITSVPRTPALAGPTAYQLFQNYPNPFNPGTTIQFTVTRHGMTRLRIVNILGQEVAMLFAGNADPNRMYSVYFNASSLASGVYFSVLESGDFRQVKKMILMK